MVGERALGGLSLVLYSPSQVVISYFTNRLSFHEWLLQSTFTTRMSYANFLKPFMLSV